MPFLNFISFGWLAAVTYNENVMKARHKSSHRYPNLCCPFGSPTLKNYGIYHEHHPISRLCHPFVMDSRPRIATHVVFVVVVFLTFLASCLSRGNDHHKNLAWGVRRNVVNRPTVRWTSNFYCRGGRTEENHSTLLDEVDSNSSIALSSSYSPPPSIEILNEKIVYSGWRTILRRTVQMRNGKVVDFDLVGVKTGEGAVLIFAWDSRNKTATMIREYMPASHRIMFGLAAGLIEDKHGHDTELAARHELEEECHLRGGEWILLTKEPVAMDKYSTTKMYCYLVIDPEPEENPKPLDDEEDIEIVSGVTIPEILEWLVHGEMNLVGSWGALLAIEKLRDLGEYP